MMAAMFEQGLGARLGADRVLVQSAGFGPPGLPAIADAVDAMGRRNLDVSAHRSQQVSADLVQGVDVVLTAERDHVVKIAALSPQAFRYSMTMPEFLRLASGLPSGDRQGLTEWLQSLTADRSASGYLRADVDEINDPTGSAARVFERAVVELEQQCAETAQLLCGALR